MDPYYEQKLIDEVQYLHSLWHQGPPSNPNPNRNPNHNSSIHVQQLNNGNTKRRPRPKNPNKNPQSDPILPKPSNFRSSKRQRMRLKSRTKMAQKKTPETQEQARFAATQVHQKALKAAQEFFAGDVDSDEEASGTSIGDGYEEYKFFFKLFIEDSELRVYYEKNHDVGDFCCLVCCGVGENVGMRFKHCAGLVQHSMEIGKVKKKRGHRAFGRVVCKVLGWDIDMFPSTNLLVRTSAKPECQEEELNNFGERSKGDGVANEIENNQKGVVAGVVYLKVDGLSWGNFFASNHSVRSENRLYMKLDMHRKITTLSCLLEKVY
ncbi:unnamed protein product [Camellia sinensis]